jgi:hypothetical protein
VRTSGQSYMGSDAVRTVSVQLAALRRDGRIVYCGQHDGGFQG